MALLLGQGRHTAAPANVAHWRTAGTGTSRVAHAVLLDCRALSSASRITIRGTGVVAGLESRRKVSVSSHYNVNIDLYRDVESSTCVQRALDTGTSFDMPIPA
jgi:hypothetical protein